MDKIALVVTTISKPNPVLQSLAQGCRKHGWDFIIAGDLSSPADFKLEGSDYYDIPRQKATKFLAAENCRTKHYARKNVGYLIALQKGASIIVETDDDNFPEEGFWQHRVKAKNAPVLRDTGWVNVYSYYSDNIIWPRGLPLPYIHSKVPATLAAGSSSCPIQQGLANDNPDVDAIYRLVLPLPQRFKNSGDVALGKNAWSPFNSQNTTWWKETFPLLYLPSYCPFRMTDIWRSLIAQRIAWENQWSILFHNATVYQERNAHNLMHDFADEVPGYLHTDSIQKILAALPIKAGVEHIPDAMRLCYASLVEAGIFDVKEKPVLDAWLTDIKKLI